MRSMLLIALVALVSPAQAAAGPEGAPTAVAQPSATAIGDKLICRREQTIGSNVPGKRICKPKSQILAEQAAAREAARDMTSPKSAGSSNN